MGCVDGKCAVPAGVPLGGNTNGIKVAGGDVPHGGNRGSMHEGNC